MADAYLDALADAFRERLVPGWVDLAMKNDPVFQYLQDSKMRTARDPISKEYKIIYTVVTSLAGGLAFTGVSGNQTLDLGTGARPVINEDFDAFPGIQESAMPGVARYSVKLTGVRGNVVIPFATLQADQMDFSIGNYAALIMKKHIELWGHIMACSFYVDDDAALATINISNNSSNVTHTAGTHTVTVTCDAGENLIENGRVRRLKPGMYVDLWKPTTSQGAWNKTGFCIITSAVNYNQGKWSMTFYFEKTSEADAFANGTDCDGSYILPANAVLDKTGDCDGYSILPCGYKQWLRSSGTLYGAFGDTTVDTLPELASLTDSNVGDVTETVLNQYLARHFENGGDADTIITTSGVVVNLLDYPHAQSMIQYQRQGQPADIRLGWRSIDYTYEGRTFRIHASPYMSNGELVILKASNGNLQRHFPPRVPKFGTQAGFESAIQWIGTMFGPSIWLPTSNNGRVADGAQAPYIMMMQRTAADPKGVLLTGCTETSL